MYQQEIKFFWPLTEQIPLDLDYSVCVKPNLYVNSTITSSYAFDGNSGLTTSVIECRVNPSEMTVAVDKLTFTLKDKPNVLRRLVYKIIGVNWKT